MSAPTDRRHTVRRRLILTGVVQGVGFRPQVSRLAAHYPVTGLCGNDDFSVFVEAQGDRAVVADFLAAVRRELPPLARVIASNDVALPLVEEETAFTIVASRRVPGAVTLIPPDTATCPDCLADMSDPANRRYAYPFTTCTNCGPRLSIICDLPYDRPSTTMACFPLCDACRREYGDPADRRYHAQPISCFDCGPHLWLEASPAHLVPPLPAFGPIDEGIPALLVAAEAEAAALALDRRTASARAIGQARALLRAGHILGVKGIGGFTLMCEARDGSAVARLRERKLREGKPFAVMAGSVAAAQELAILDGASLAALQSPERPIVLAPLAAGYDLAESVAPRLDQVGVMLPYAPLHHLLLDPDQVVVATSANLSGWPLIHRNDDARRLLSGVVDAFLMHDRGIHVPVEDSVVMADAGAVHPVRRSRGYAPLPVKLGDEDRCVLAVGAELKNTFALTRDGLAFLSAHIGDMGTLPTQRAFEASVAQQEVAHRRSPALIVVDKHPSYATHAWGVREAERQGIPVLQVQHHHAHALALLAEQELIGQPLTCAVFDGTGYGDEGREMSEFTCSSETKETVGARSAEHGDDGTIWGGEILALGADPLDFDRRWHLPGFWLPGGDSAVRHPWKQAVALLRELGHDPRSVPALARAIDDGRIDAGEWAVVEAQLDRRVGVVRTTSAGRLFDAVSALLGVCLTVTYEAQAAMELEALARTWTEPTGTEGLDVAGGDPGDADLAGLVAQLLDGLAQRQPAAQLARLFHDGLAAITANALLACSPAPEVGLTGGVFANRLFTRAVAARLAAKRYRPIIHHAVPANDGGLALGQALAGYLTVTRK